MTVRRRFGALLALCVPALMVFAAGCGGDDEGGAGGTTATTASATVKVGFLYVGPKDDYGYNQAAYEGSLEIAKAFPEVELLQAENVPETAEAERVMERMISQGAKLIFPTSFGHLTPALNVAKKHPDVVFVHQGGLEPEPKLDNVGTYFGTVYEPVYLAGIAAAKATTSKKLGYIVAFPIPQTLANVNAFELGAQSVDHTVTTTVVFTANWCAPATQAEAAKTLLSKGVDVLTQHQDCTKTIIQTAEAGGAKSVGYHYDASALAPAGWLTGSEWNWGPMYTDIVKTVIDGGFKESKYNGDYRVGLKTGDNPFVQSPFGAGVDDATKALVDTAKDAITKDGIFKGPIVDQSGKEVVPSGTTLDYAKVEQMDFLVKGVEGSLPK